ncbi:uncharacterized protein LOC116916426 [Daphnia magna]|uniref:uncharacterized protein LOC116916426 n=1 Tax=Daphnia magna TaxID=35525 RepID=UPI001E1BA29A|nr:uncharacterized protein LOC116916426 [Daphnia magna]
MKVSIVIALLCLVGLSVSFPAESSGSFPERRNLRRKNAVTAAQPFRNRQSEPLQPEYLSAKPKQTSEYTPLGPDAQDRESSPQQNFARPGFQQKRKPISPIRPVAEKYVAEASNAYDNNGYDAGTYDDGHLKFEQGVQNNAASYNSDQGVKDGRVQFSIAGQQGPNSYRFGYDTGKGADRTFRIEERDNSGVIHGRYGYYDPSGKFRVVNYKAHPESGFAIV